MNIKKQLNKIRDYVEALEELSDKTHNELLQYKLAAHKFVNFESPDHIAREEFKKLLGDTMFIGGEFSNVIMEKMVDNHWTPIENEHPEYSRVVGENARLREMLRWHPVSELPELDGGCVSRWSKTVIFQVDRLVDPELAFYDYRICYWRKLESATQINTFPQSRWCYIPEEKDGE